MPDAIKSLTDHRKEMEKILHNALLEFERNTGLAVTAVMVHRIDAGRVLPITVDALSTKVELIA